MILAAGRGERLRPITDEVPKAMVEVRGEILIDRHLRMLCAAGVEHVVINLGWLGERIMEHVGSGTRFGVNVVYSPEYDNVLETGGGICRALPMLGPDPFWVVNGDIYTDFVVPDDDLPRDTDARLVLVDGLVRRGDTRSLTYSGIAQYRPTFFNDAGTGRFSVAPMLMQAADEGRLAGTLHDGTWEDVGTPERLAQLNRA